MNSHHVRYFFELAEKKMQMGNFVSSARWESKKLQRLTFWLIQQEGINTSKQCDAMKQVHLEQKFPCHFSKRRLTLINRQRFFVKNLVFHQGRKIFEKTRALFKIYFMQNPVKNIRKNEKIIDIAKK